MDRGQSIVLHKAYFILHRVFLCGEQAGDNQNREESWTGGNPLSEIGGVEEYDYRAEV